MSPLTHFEDLGKAQLPRKPVHLAIGMFDGVHRGHRAVIDPAVRAARADDGIAAVLTFWPHPSALFRPNGATQLMQDSEQKTRVLATLGVDMVFTQPFTREFAAVPAEDFVSWLKQRVPTLRGIYVGENFRFGQGRKGDATVLQRTGPDAGVTVCSAARVTLDGLPVSSTRVRTHIVQGEMEEANALLGYSYFSFGTVTPGKRLGRTIGFPTLNLPWAPPLRPRFGVYVVQIAGTKSERRLPGVANYGLRPTVEITAPDPKLEVHVLADCPFEEGDEVTVEWLSFLRPEQKFPGLDALRAQIARDRDAALAYFASRP